MDNDFSAREVKLLKKLIKKKDYQKINYEDLCENFPGKSIQKMKKAVNFI